MPSRSVKPAIAIIMACAIQACVSTDIQPAQLEVAPNSHSMQLTGSIPGGYSLALGEGTQLTLRSRPLGISLSAFEFGGSLVQVFETRARAAADSMFLGSAGAGATLTLTPSIEEDRIVVLSRGYFKAAARVRIGTTLVAVLEKDGRTFTATATAQDTLVEDEQETTTGEIVPVLVTVADRSFQRAIEKVMNDLAAQARAADELS